MLHRKKCREIVVSVVSSKSKYDIYYHFYYRDFLGWIRSCADW